MSVQNIITDSIDDDDVIFVPGPPIEVVDLTKSDDEVKDVKSTSQRPSIKTEGSNRKMSMS